LARLEMEGLEPITITAERIFPEEEQEQLSVFFEEASRSVQGILADFIFDPFESGIEGLVDSFAKMLQRMAAEAIAADIAGKIFGTGGVSSGGGWLGKAAGVLGGLFGGGSAASASIGTINGFDFSSIGLASGGYTGDGGKYEPAGIVHAGEFVTRSEVTRQPGAIGFLEAFNRVGMQALQSLPGFAEGGLVAAMPAPIRSPTLGMRSSGMTVQNNFTINAPNGTVSRATEQQIAAAAARGASRANVRNN
jgi:phage-related minor tail protein